MQNIANKIIDDQELKIIELDIMMAVHNFCEKNNLRYYLWGGTLLGAIRHNGFIPWDDDIDIAMFRADFEKFVHAFDSEYYGVSYCESDLRHPYWHAKVYHRQTKKTENIFRKKEFSLGVDIDVFVLDSFVDFDEVLKSAQWRQNQIDRYWKSLRPTKTGSLRAKVAGIVYRTLLGADANKIARKINEAGQSYGDGDGAMLYADCNIKKPLKMDKKWFEDRMLHKFEDKELYIPGDYHALLQACYGDYMKLPPEEERVTHHSFEAYWL